MSITNDDLVVIKEMYCNGEPHEKIAKAVGMDRSVLSRCIRKMIAEGEMAERTRINKAKIKGDAKRAIILDAYLAGEDLENIAKKAELSQSTTKGYIAQLRREGKISQARFERKKETQPRKKAIKKLRNNVGHGLPTLPKGQTVNCCLEIAHQCCYGTGGNGNAGNCNYVLIKHDMRPCSPRACTCFSQISKDNPRQTWGDF